MIWKTWPKYGLYEASSTGLVRNKKSGRILKSQIGKNGYKTFTCTMGGKFRKNVSFHRVVAESFLGLSDLHVNHKDCDKLNNNINNLEYCTREENTRHAVLNGRKSGARGENHGSNKYSAKQILKVKKLLLGRLKSREIVRETGVSRDIIYLVSKNKIWKDLKLKSDRSQIA